MKREDVASVLNKGTQCRCGCVNGIEFGVDEGPFETSSCKYVAFHIGNFQGDFYFDTLEEFLEGFQIDGVPIGQLLDHIAYFKPVLCND